MKQKKELFRDYKPQLVVVALIIIGCLTIFVSLNYLSTSAAVSDDSNSSKISDQIENLNGLYNGTLVITAPVNIGVMDMTIQLTSTKGTSTGYVLDSAISHFAQNPAINASVYEINDIPKFTIQSDSFIDIIAGKTITQTIRAFSINGEALSDGNILTGTYNETITGYTQEPLQIAGSVLLTKQTIRSAQIPPSSTPGSPTPAPTKVQRGNFDIFLPIIDD